ALGVEAEPTESAAQVLRVDAGEAAVRVHVLDAQPCVQAVVVTLHPLVGVKRFAVSERPLPFAAGAPRITGRRARTSRGTFRPIGISGFGGRLVGDDRHRDPPYGFVQPGGRTEEPAHLRQKGEMVTS